MSFNQNKKLARRIHIFLLAGAMAFVTAAPVYAIPANTQLPSGFTSVSGNSQYDNNGNITQQGLTAVNNWKDFSIGADAVVNFTSDTANFNSVNFVNSGTVSEIYGQINANGGNIFLANTAGVQIGGSAQINVGSLYVTNKDLDSIRLSLNKDSTIDNIRNSIANIKTTNAELMSLGGIVTEGNVTFDGDRVVIDVDHLYQNTDGTAMDTASQLTIKTTDADDVVLGYTNYDSENKTYLHKNESGELDSSKYKTFNVSEDGTSKTIDGYMWVENLLQLQAMETNLEGNYALRNSIDANFSADSKYNYAKDENNVGKGFASIGNTGDNKAFTGNFDGLGYDIFDLNVKDGQDYAGLFGYVDNAIIRNFTLNSGSIAGGENTGAAVGYAHNSTISNIINTADVTGTSNVGGLVGSAQNSTLDGLINTGTITGTNSNIGGIAGNITGSSITGETYNLGAVTGDNTTYNVGGIVGSADASTIGNAGEDAFVIYNELDITGGYNVGGIAGNITDSNTNDSNTMVIQNVANDGAVKATGADTEKYSYHTACNNQQIASDVNGTDYQDGVATINVKVANAGGIVGNANNASVSNAENSGDVTTSTTTPTDNKIGTYYNAGNVGGIIGRAENTNIATVINKENNVAGAHNVGGAVGYLTGNSQVDGAINNGGDITATGARRADGNTNINNGFAQESVRSDGSEIFNIGNTGGIVGYMYGDNTYIVNSANRGTVHSAYYENDVPVVAQAANVGGIAGKIDRTSTKTLEQITSTDENKQQAAISDSYNTGDVQGYTGVGGVAGFMYNGEVTASYNLGNISSTRIATSAGTTEATNMGGIVGDSTEKTDARILIYDVYNTGKIGDESYDTYGRHLGGIVGRLSGQIEKAYNTGDIYNGSNVVGGVVGYWYAGSINNTFNTGNITVINNNTAQSQVGGIVGAVDISTAVDSNVMKLSNSYNLGTLRSFKPNNSAGANTVGGIVGYIANWSKESSRNPLMIDGVYTLGNLYAAQSQGGTYTRDDNGVGAIVGARDDNNNAQFSIGTTGAYYITPENNSFKTIIQAGTINDNGVKSIDFQNRYKKEEYGSYQKNNNSYNGFQFSLQSDGNVTDNTDNNWRIYEDITTPILNAFLPNSEKFFSDTNNMDGISSIQYGTADNPLMTIINANKADLNYNWSDLGISGAAGLAVYGNGSLTLNGFTTSGANTYFGGIIYSDGALTLNGTSDNFNLGSGSKLYGSSVTLDASNSNITINGSVTSTNGDITIKGDDIEIIGKLTAAAQGDKTTIAGINRTPEKISDAEVNEELAKLNDPNKSMQNVTDRFAHTTDAATKNGNITITANGMAEVLYGHLGTGSVNIGANAAFTVTGNDSVYVDTDLLNTKGNISLTSKYGEALLDLTNTANAHITDTDSTGKEALHQFLQGHQNGSTGISLSGAADNEKITIDMWDNNNNTFNLNKYDTNGITLSAALNDLYVNGYDNVGAQYTYIWISSAEQLKGIQAYKDAQDNSGKTTGILSYNFALKNDIDASQITDYKAIASDQGEEFTGTFDGRDNRIIGLTVGKNDAQNTVSSAGIFGTIGIIGKGTEDEKKGSVKDVRIYSSNFYGKDYAGAVAGINKGTVTGVITLGNHVEVFGSKGSLALNNTTGAGTVHVGAAGGIAGINYGSILSSSASDSVIAGHSGTVGGLKANILATAGGIAGINEGSINNVTADSAITANEDTTYSLGGIAGVNRNNGSNNGAISNAYNTGIVHGEYGDGNITSNSVGGIAGVNTGSISDVYNSADITGGNYVGGIAGYNYKKESITESGKITNAVNAGDILADFTYTGEDKKEHNYEYTGGLAGYNSGSISSGRNTGEIYGGNYVGGMVGGNAAGSTLTNLSNSVFAAITGESYVGGIAGRNYGNINATDSSINNYGKVYGQHYVGGIAGANEKGGTIENTISSISLYVKNPETVDDKDDTNNPSYFGGVVGQNSGIINGATNASSVDVAAAGATYVGGIIGHNTATGTLQGEIANAGTVSGLANVGGIIGENENNEILNNQNKDLQGNIIRLQITNSGNVSAKKGGAAGIFYANTGSINNADLTNTGIVTGGTASDSVTGGLFGKNIGNITNSTLTNSGIVTGGGTVGGLIGENSGNISKSSLKNEAGATVIGINNVGGLIGINTGTITGGRDSENSYYKYQIYNNGVINVGTWADNDNDGVVDTGEIGAPTGISTNIGGLIGSNTGTLIAGYNTGAINAGDSTNVGGIVGNNEGKVDQVFNTVMTDDDSQAAAITGGTNVGGIVGDNGGQLSNAYNTTKVVGTDKVGAIAGNNANSVSHVYNTWNTNGITIIGDGTTADNAYNVDSKNQEDYKNQDNSGLDFNNTWKIYEGNSNPLLSVFLTKVSVDQEKLNSYMNQHKVYNGKNQQLTSDDITALIDCGAIYVNGLTKEEAFEAFYNSKGLISSTEHKNAGSYSDWLYSGQIASSGTGDTFNPNNLGYDIDLTASIAKAQIIVDLNDIERIYGDTTITNGTYGFKYNFSNVSNEEDQNTLRNELNGNLTMQQVNTATDDAALVDDGSKTNDAGDYTWTGIVNIADGYNNNYEFVVSDVNGNMQSTGSTITATGSSKVNRRQLSINDIIASIVYGNQGNNGFTVTGGELSNIVYNDEVKLNTNLEVEDANIVGSDYAINKGNRDTADVGIYEDSLKYTGLGLTGKDADNYYIADTATGTIKVTQATINVDLADVERTYGSTDITNGGYNVNNITIAGNVNGDNYGKDNFTVTVAEDSALTGNTSGNLTQDVGEYKYTGEVTGSDDKLNQNYKIVVNNSTSDSNVGTGKSIINKAELSIIIDNVSTTYGTAFDENKYSYSLSGLVNGDRFDDVSGDIDAAAGGYNNTATGSDGKATQNAGDNYSLTFNEEIINKDILKNYNITTIKAGNSTVNKATISIGANDVQINLGQTPNYTGTDINGVLVNGDSFDTGYHYGVADSAIEDIVGTYNNAIGIWIGNNFYDLAQASNWTGSGIDTFFSNYDINFTPGTLTVGDKVEPDYNWSYLYNDNPFDRIKNFRERKAEVNFVAGGMEI